MRKIGKKSIISGVLALSLILAGTDMRIGQTP